jgi:hypothetical protein
MKRMLFFGLAALLVTGTALAQTVKSVENGVLYFEEGRFGGWPANVGIWNWGDEIVVGFMLGYFKDTGKGHPIDREKPNVIRFARSVDGGESWAIEKPDFDDRSEGALDYKECPGGIDFTQPNFSMMFRMEGSNHGYSYFLWSNDRCKTWNGPYKLPDFGRKGIYARTDYIVEGKHEMTAFMTAAKDGDGEGWPFACRTTDGGKTWEFISWIGEQPDYGYAIMPSTLRTSETDLVTWIRCKGRNEAGEKHWWIYPYLSTDNAKTWTLQPQYFTNNAGNPPHMIRLKDGRLIVTYGHRLPPYGVRARISKDDGKTWGDELIVRDDGGEWDLGYVRTCQRADGKLVSAYYFNDGVKKERYIGVSIWEPGE